MLRSPDLFADGLSGYLRGDTTHETEAAGRILGEVVLLARKWLLAQFTPPKDR